MSRESSITMTPPEPAIDPAAASESKSIGISSIDISRSIVEPSGCFSFSLNRLVGAQDFRGAAAGNDRLQSCVPPSFRRHVVDQLAHRDRADFNFEITGPLHVAADANDARAGVVRAAEPGIFRAAHRDDVLHVAERLDVVHDRRAHVEAEHGGKIGRLDPRIGALAFERFDQAGFFAADVSAGAAMDVNLDVEAGAENIFSEEIVARASSIARSRIFAPSGNSPRM